MRYTQRWLPGRALVARAASVPRRLRRLFARLRLGLGIGAPRTGHLALRASQLPGPLPRRPGIRRLLFVSHNLNLEGAPLVQLLLARGLRQRGYEIAVVSSTDGPLGDRYRADGMPVTVGNALYGIGDATDYRRRMRGLARRLQRGGFDLVLANTLQSFWAVTVAQLADIPVVWTVHESANWEHYYGYLRPPLRPIALEALRRADRLVFVCDATRRLFAALEAPGRLHRIHNGLDVEAIDRFTAGRSRDAIRAAHGLKDGDRVVTVVGTTCERKGQLDFLRMARQLDPTGADRTRFYVVGTRPGAYLR